jgi:HEAT repeat protein
VILFVIAALRQPPDPAFGGKLASQWCGELLNSNVTVRENAQAALRALGEPGVPQLRALLRRRNGPWEKPLVQLDRLLPFLNYSGINEDACRVTAAQMLGELGAKGRDGAPDLVASLAFEGSADESDRALFRIGASAVPAVQAGVTARDPEVRFRAVRLLREMDGVSQSTLPILLGATHDGNSAVRREAVESIASMLLRNEIIQEDCPGVQAILRLTADSASDVRAQAMQALGEMGVDHPRVNTALRRGLCDESLYVKLDAAKSLWDLGGSPEEVLPVLLSILETSEGWRAAYLLGDMGARAAPAIPALIGLLVRERVPRPFRTPPSSAIALGKIGSAAVPELTLALENRNSRVRISALMALNFMGPAGRSAIPQLLKLLADDNAEVRHTTALTLASAGAEPSSIIAGLSDCLHADDIYMRSAAATHLRAIAPEQNWVVPAE